MHKTMSVFFSGGGARISLNDESLVGQLLSAELFNAAKISENSIVLGFDGLGRTDGLLGMIFAKGIDRQCDIVVRRIKQEITNGHTISLNVFGHSRGGATALLLAKKLSTVNPKQLSIHLAMLDPAPGNLVTISTLDGFGLSLANRTMDLSTCKPLKRVLALYSNEPLTLGILEPFTSAITPIYPPHTEVEEDTIAGDHFAGTGIESTFPQINQEEKKVFVFDNWDVGLVVFARTLNFLKSCGTEFNIPEYFKIRSYWSKDVLRPITELDQALLEYYFAQNKLEFNKSSKSTHSWTGTEIHTKEQAEYYNLHHQKLAGVPRDISKVRMTIEKGKSLIASLKQTMHTYPKTTAILKWTLLSFSLANLLFFTGGLAAIPLIAALGPLGILAATAFIGLAIGGLLAIKHLIVRFIENCHGNKSALNEKTSEENESTSITATISVNKAPEPVGTTVYGSMFKPETPKENIGSQLHSDNLEPVGNCFF